MAKIPIVDDYHNALGIDPAEALERRLKIGIISQEVELKENAMMEDMVSKSISSLTRKSSENMFEESHGEDSDDWIRAEKPANYLDKSLFKTISRAEKVLTQEQLHNWKDIVFEFKNVGRIGRNKVAPAKVTPFVVNLRRDAMTKRVTATRFSPAHREFMGEDIDMLVRMG